MKDIISSSKSFFKRQAKLVIGITLGLVIGGLGSAVVLAAVPNINGSVSVCYRTSGLGANGQARIINSATQSCNSNETTLALDKATPGNFITDLVGTDFTNADLRYRNFAETDMHNVIFFETNLAGSTLENANLSNVRFGGSSFGKTKGTSFKNSNVSNAFFTDGIEIAEANFSGANFSGATFSLGNKFHYTNFSGAILTGVQFLDAPQIDNSNLASANFENISIDTASLTANSAPGANFKNAHFTNVDFTYTNLSSALLTGATWSNTICPDSTNSDNNGNTCIGHLTP
jgi:uncharacterized protein YjbI with pentapeptide repeats